MDIKKQLERSMQEVDTLREAISLSATMPVQFQGFIYLKGVPIVRWCAPDEK